MANPIKINAERILVELFKNNPEGNLEFDGKDIVRFTGLDPLQINDAIDHLDKEGLIKRNNYLGTSPFHFGGVKLNINGKNLYYEKLNLNEYGSMARINTQPTQMKDHIIISFAQKDEYIINKFIDLVLENGLGLKTGVQIFATCAEGGKPKNGEDFKKFIKEKLEEAKIVIQFISRNYKSSATCLNEMGAVWALNLNVKILIIEEGLYDVGFIHSNNQQGFLTNKANILEICDDIKKSFDLNISSARLNNKIDDFFELVKVYNQGIDKNKYESIKILEDHNVSNSQIAEESLVEIKKRGFYCFTNDKFREIPVNPFEKFVLGFDRNPDLIIEASKLDAYGKIGSPLPELLKCDFYREKRGGTWVVYNGKRRKTPPSVNKVLVTRYRVKFKSIVDNKFFKIEVGDSLLDCNGRF